MSDHRASLDKNKELPREDACGPPLFRSDRAIDEFLWRGSPDAKLVPRIGAGLLGSLLVGGGFLVLLDPSPPAVDWMGWLFAVLLILVGARVLLNAFRRHAKRRTSEGRPM